MTLSRLVRDTLGHDTLAQIEAELDAIVAGRPFSQWPAPDARDGWHAWHGYAATGEWPL